MNTALALPTPLPRPTGRTDWTLPAPSRRWAVVAVVGLHALAVLGLMQAGGLMPPKPAHPDVSLTLIATPTPPHPAPPLPQPAAPKWAAPNVVAPLPLPEFVAAQPARELPMAAPVSVTLPAPPARATAPSEDALAPARAVSPPPAPKPVAASSLRYRVEPAVEVPRLSRRAGESGNVQLRVVFDAEGRPRQIELARSSGFARLDAQALEAMQAARIQPVVESGHAIAVVALATLAYELD